MNRKLVAALVGVFVLSAAFCALVGEAIYWLRFGEWPPLSIGWLFRTPETGWVGLQKVIAFIFALPLSVLLAAVGFLSLLGVVLEDD